MWFVNVYSVSGYDLYCPSVSKSRGEIPEQRGRRACSGAKICPYHFVGRPLTTTSNYTVNAIVDAGESDTKAGWDDAALNDRLFCVTTQNNCQAFRRRT
jgi:hypothetical protein